MLDWLVGLDRALFVFVNQTLAWAPLDAAFAFITHKYFYLGVAAAFTLFLPSRYRLAGLYAALTALVALGLADASIARVIKPLVARHRPLYELPHVRALVDQGDTHSFPSSHAANSFAFAVAVLLYYRRLGCPPRRRRARRLLPRLRRRPLPGRRRRRRGVGDLARRPHRLPVASTRTPSSTAGDTSGR